METFSTGDRVMVLSKSDQYCHLHRSSLANTGFIKETRWYSYLVKVKFKTGNTRMVHMKDITHYKYYDSKCKSIW